MTFQPYPTRSGFIFLGAAIIFAAVTIYLVTRLTQQNDWADIFQLIIGLLVTLVITGLALYWTTIAFRFRYDLNRNGLAIQWGLTQHRIPFDTIEKIIPGKNLPTMLKFRGLNIVGLQFGWGEWADYGRVKIQATAPLVDSLLLVTANQSYLISPRSPDDFIKAWQARQALGPTQHWSAGVQRSWPLNSPLLTDTLTWWLVGLAALAYLSHFGYLSLKFSELPPSLPIHFNALGQADRIADKSVLLTLPAAGVIVLILNTFLGGVFYRSDRMAAYLLWGSAIFMQLCLWIALLTITA
jgi:hypothetical protein